MKTDLTLFQLASARAAHAATRTQLAARNIAHADTPGYRAVDLPPFAEALQRAGGGGAVRPREVATGAESPSGNTVSLEGEMMRLADAQGAHDMALAVYGQAIQLMKLAAGRGR